MRAIYRFALSSEGQTLRHGLNLETRQSMRMDSSLIPQASVSAAEKEKGRGEENQTTTTVGPKDVELRVGMAEEDNRIENNKEKEGEGEHKGGRDQQEQDDDDDDDDDGEGEEEDSNALHLIHYHADADVHIDDWHLKGFIVEKLFDLWADFDPQKESSSIASGCRASSSRKKEEEEAVVRSGERSLSYAMLQKRMKMVNIRLSKRKMQRCEHCSDDFFRAFFMHDDRPSDLLVQVGSAKPRVLPSQSIVFTCMLHDRPQLESSFSWHHSRSGATR